MTTPEPTDPSPAPETAEEGATAATAAPALPPPLPGLPEELLALHAEHGRYWEIDHDPRCRSVPYTARPRAGGRTVRTDTVRMLARVLTAAAPEEHDTDDRESDRLPRSTPAPRRA